MFKRLRNAISGGSSQGDSPRDSRGDDNPRQAQAAAPSARMAAQAFLEQGVDAINAGNYAGALQYFSQAIEAFPQDVNAICYRGRAYEMLGDYEHAWADFSSVIQIDPTYSLGYVNRANMNLKLRRYEEAERDARKAIELDPDQEASHFNLGLALSRKNEALRDPKLYDHAELEEAIEHLEILSKQGDFEARMAITQIRGMINGVTVIDLNDF